RLVRTEPVPGLPLGDIVLRDVDQLLALADLALRPIQQDAHAVFAIEKLDVVEHVALRRIGLGKAKQLAIAVDLGLPAGGKIAFDPRSVERRSRGPRASGHARAATGGNRPCQTRIEALDIAESVLRGFEGAE